jgi:hypothetical protein
MPVSGRFKKEGKRNRAILRLQAQLQATKDEKKKAVLTKVIENTKANLAGRK